MELLFFVKTMKKLNQTSFKLIFAISVLFLLSFTGNTFSYPVLPSTNVIPNAYAMINGTAAFTGPIASTPRTYQQLISENQLTNMVGSIITGITWRLPSNATTDWPGVETVISSYDVYLSQSVPPSQRNLTFALNVVGTQTQVRSGSWTIPFGSFRSGGSPNDFGYVVNFTTPYMYTGGHLLVEIRHTGFTGATSRSVDGIGTSVSGYGTDFSACWGSGNTATSGSQGNFSVLNILTLASNIEPTAELPGNYSLSQNFPNPFNPVTDIKFEIPKNEFVTLKVFDKLGREVQTLVNESKAAGSYKVSFNASNLSSGIYFYTINAGSYSETKKMMLIK